MKAASSIFTSVRILVVDDFQPFREFVSAALREKPKFRIVGEASDGLEAVNQAKGFSPDIV